jgi:NHLM bacteriocin system ABC transporter peptidase/ATP-binding protein
MSRLLDRFRSAVSRVKHAVNGGPEEGHRRVSTPTVLQMEAVECGAAALGTVLAYYNRYEPLEKLRTACGVSRDGSKASNMVIAARKFGLKTNGYKTEPEGLREHTPPMIVHWNFNHFVVFEGFKDGKAYLNDPAVGPRVVSYREFDESFTGVVLTFEPGDEFEPGGNRSSLLQALQQRLKGSHSALAFVVLAGLALVVPGLLEPTFQKVYVDNVLIRGLDGWVRPTLIAMGVTVVFYASLLWLRQQHLLRLEMKIALKTSGEFFWHVLRLPVVFFTQRSSGDISTRVGLNDRIAKLLSSDLATNALNVIVIVFYGALMLAYDVWLTLIVVSVALLNVLALQFVSRKRRDINLRMQQERGKLMGTAMGGLQSIETLKATGAESDFFTRWSGYHAKVVNAQQSLGLYTQVLTVVPPLLVATSVALVFGIGGMRIMDGHLTIGMLVGFQVLMFSFLTPVSGMVQLGSTMQEVDGDMKRLDDVLRHDLDPALDGPLTATAVSDPPASDSSAIDSETDRTGEGERSSSADTAAAMSDAVSRPTTHGDGAGSATATDDLSGVKLSGFLELKDVTFGYSPLEDPLINNFNLRLTPGTRVALVGGSGSGKSTIARLVCGLYEPWSGQVLFDGKPRTEVDRSAMANSFSVVDQQIVLFEDTIRQNLSLWDEAVPEQHLIQAAKDACIHAEITARPNGYDEVLEENGQNFSGGQRQRLEIARALATNPSIMVLDEATSALDPTTEKHIDDNLRRRGCTCLIIAHRLSTIRDCDEIVVLSGGRVAQRGTHDELVQSEGAYTALLSSM